MTKTTGWLVVLSSRFSLRKMKAEKEATDELFFLFGGQRAANNNMVGIVLYCIVLYHR